jgi:hypothetical protein
MTYDPRAGLTKLSDEEDGPHRRRAGRLPQELLACQYGAVRDLSSGGMRVICRRLPPSTCVIRLMGGPRQLDIKAKIAWGRRLGLFKHEIGFEFVDVSPEMASELTALASANRTRRLV